jgi:hypothetical protein
MRNVTMRVSGNGFLATLVPAPGVCANTSRHGAGYPRAAFKPGSFQAADALATGAPQADWLRLTLVFPSHKG